MTEALKKKRLARFILFFSMAMCVCIVTTALYINSRSKLEYSEMTQLAANKAEKVSSVLTELLYKTHILEAFVRQSDGNITNFDSIASTILDNPAIKNVILAPDGKVEFVYPLEGNQEVLGLDFFSESEGNKEAIMAKQKGKLVLGGPFNLVQGGQALVGRLPIYTKNDTNSDFWGIASITLNYPQALAGAELEQLQDRGFAFEIWRINPDSQRRQVIAQSDHTYSKHVKFVEYPMDVLNSQWYFRLSPIRNWYQFPETWMFLAVGAIVSALIGFLALHNYDLLNVKRELELLSNHDSLTGICNRRGGFAQLARLVEQKEPFILTYIDLDGFKKINDKYGHSSGDRILRHFTDLVLNHIDDTQNTFARIGGDEFIIVFKGMKDIDEAKEFFEMLNRGIDSARLKIHGDAIELTYSVGYGAFPDDGLSVDEIMAIADTDMYTAKKQ